MPQEVIDRAFEPFFTTKEMGKGSGLGLSMVYGFVKQSGGQIKIESAVGGGTVVRLYLPRAEAPSPAVAAPIADRRAVPPTTGHHILVVDDDASLRQMTAARLAELGHRVLEAASPALALEILGRGTPVDLLLTDVVMPGGMSGFDLAHRALEQRPGLKVIFASGYASSFPTTGGMPGELLQKPYRDEDLQRALARALGERPPPQAVLGDPDPAAAAAGS